MTNCPYESYYQQQVGTGSVNVYRGVPYQRGHGVGNFFKALYRGVMPLVKRGAQAIGKEAFISGVNVLKDVTQNKPFKESMRLRLGEAKQSLKRKASQKMESLLKGSGYKRRKTVKRRHSSNIPPPVRSLKKKKKKKSTNCASKLIDIFH